MNAGRKGLGKGSWKRRPQSAPCFCTYVFKKYCVYAGSKVVGDPPVPGAWEETTTLIHKCFHKYYVLQVARVWIRPPLSTSSCSGKRRPKPTLIHKYFKNIVFMQVARVWVRPPYVIHRFLGRKSGQHSPSYPIVYTMFCR